MTCSYRNRLSKRVEKVTKEEVKAAIQNADDEVLSIRNLMSKQESNVIITDPREYQIELFEQAKNQNIIAVLDTGMTSRSYPSTSDTELFRRWKDTYSSFVTTTHARSGA